MCCFSRNVTSVDTTRIFARMSEPQRQALVYQMNFKADEDLAMILPLPVIPGSAEDSLKFINLKEYGSFFDDLNSGFPAPDSRSDSLKFAPPPTENKAPLKVEQVGSFEASFVPAIKDFSRLDARFRLADGIWEKLPTYADYGFAVFKLRKGEHKVHPMAFTFPTRHAKKLFFPTVHIHDGQVHEKEGFDHQLYCQVNRPGLFAMTSWDESPQIAKSFTKPEKSKQLIIGDKHVYRLTLRGELKNQDTYLGTA